MNRLTSAALSLVAVFSLSSAVFAQQSAAGSPPSAGSASTAPTAPAAPPNPAEFDKQMAEVQANMVRMQEQMSRNQQTRDPAERQRLLQEHWATMESAMTQMHGM